MQPLRWLGQNLSTLILAFVLSLVVWISAVTAADPNEEHIYRAVPIEQVGLGPDLLVTGDISLQVRFTIEAPASIWRRLNNNPDLVDAWVDLTGLGAGEHTVPIKYRVNVRPYRMVRIEPDTINLTLERLVTLSMPVNLLLEGETPLGYKMGSPTVTPPEATVSGSESQVAKVQGLQVSLDISTLIDTTRTSVAIRPLDGNGEPVENVTVTPEVATIDQPVNLMGGYKNVAVKVVTSGEIATGYRLTNISVSPLNVTVYSENPQHVNQLPGYVETMPVDLTDLNDDTEVRIALNLPAQVELVGEQSVLVQVGVTAIDGSQTFSIPIEELGLPPELQAQISPALVDVITTGPLPTLSTLTPASFRLTVDLSGLPAGIYQFSPVVDLTPNQVRVEAILPGTVEVVIAPSPTATATVTLGDSILTPAGSLVFPGTPTPSVSR